MIRITFYIETKDKDLKQCKYLEEFFLRTFDEVFDKYTLIDCDKRYKREDGTLTNEKILKVEVILKSIRGFNITKKCEYLKNILNQKTIHVATERIDYICY